MGDEQGDNPRFLQPIASTDMRHEDNQVEMESIHSSTSSSDSDDTDVDNMVVRLPTGVRMFNVLIPDGTGVRVWMRQGPEPNMRYLSIETLQVRQNEDGGDIGPIEISEETNFEGAVGQSNLTVAEVSATPRPIVDIRDRCFVCLTNRVEVDHINILLPCGHGWCCNNCGRQLTYCPLCKKSCMVFRIIIVSRARATRQRSSWLQTYNSLQDPIGTNCMMCSISFKNAPYQTRYVYLNCGHGWRCESCIISIPDNCEVCNGVLHGAIQIFLS